MVLVKVDPPKNGRQRGRGVVRIIRTTPHEELPRNYVMNPIFVPDGAEIPPWSSPGVDGEFGTPLGT